MSTLDRAGAAGRGVRRPRRAGCGLGGHGEDLRYWSTVSCAQCRQVQRSTTRHGRRAHRGREVGVVEAAAQRRGQRIHVARRAREHGVAVGARHLRKGAAGRWPRGRCRSPSPPRPAARSLRRGGHDGELGLGVELDDPLVAHARDELHGAGESEPLDGLGRLPTRLWLADDRERDVALGAELGHRLQQVGQALQGDIGAGGRDEPAGRALDLGMRPEEVGVDADGHEPHAIRLNPKSRWMSRIEFSLTTTMRGIWRATRACIRMNRYQRPTCRRFRAFGACDISSSRSLEIGWWSVTTVGRSCSIRSRP